MRKPARQDLTGMRFGRLVVDSLHSCENYKPKWNCICDCGGTKVATAGDLRAGDTKSCGCLVKERDDLNRSKMVKHGWRGTKEYLTWKYIKGRCYNKNSKSYPAYGGAGVVMDDDFKNDFMSFLAEIGEVPDNKHKWSVDRIDNTKGYIKGNIRWALDTQQARNKGKYSNNKTNCTGVYWLVGKCTTYAAACWYQEIDGKLKSRSRYFSVSKHGLLPAFAMACKFREYKIAELNALGYGYSENHGKIKRRTY